MPNLEFAVSCRGKAEISLTFDFFGCDLIHVQWIAQGKSKVNKFYSLSSWTNFAGAKCCQNDNRHNSRLCCNLASLRYIHNEDKGLLNYEVVPLYRYTHYHYRCSKARTI